MLPLLFCNLSEVLKMIMSFSRRSLCLCLSPSHHQTMNCINVRAASSEQQQQQQLSRHAIHWPNTIATIKPHPQRENRPHRSIDRSSLYSLIVGLFPRSLSYSLSCSGLLDCRDQWSRSNLTPWPQTVDRHLYTCCCGFAVAIRLIFFFSRLLLLLFCRLWGHPLQKTAAVAVYAFNWGLSLWTRDRLRLWTRLWLWLRRSWSPTSPSRSTLLAFVLLVRLQLLFIIFIYFQLIFCSSFSYAQASKSFRFCSTR